MIPNYSADFSFLSFFQRDTRWKIIGGVRKFARNLARVESLDDKDLARILLWEGDRRRPRWMILISFDSLRREGREERIETKVVVAAAVRFER